MLLIGAGVLAAAGIALAILRPWETPPSPVKPLASKDGDPDPTKERPGPIKPVKDNTPPRDDNGKKPDDGNNPKPVPRQPEDRANRQGRFAPPSRRQAGQRRCRRRGPAV
jgi:hypothetical protein